MTTTSLADRLGITKGRVSQLKKKGMPTDTVEAAQDWVSKNVDQNKAGRTSRRVSATKKALAEAVSKLEPSAPSIQDETWEARLARARFNEKASYAALATALQAGDAVLATRLQNLFLRSMEAVAAAETLAEKAKVSSGELLRRDDARAILTDILIPLRSALDSLPATERSRCNSQNPDEAEKALRAWRDALLLRLSQADSKL